MGRQKTYEFVRIKDKMIEEDILIVIANIREVIKDSNTGNVNVLSRHSHSAEYPLNNIPLDIQVLEAVEPTEISPQEFDQLTKLYKNDINSFLLYTP
ncbi:hypothetical protein ACOMCU_25155 [Lysinibacillus sp. UGB7]|uniref:hypothetical protein n=1 Tax=Lysinibacillus sp. UGB7 TaxID=3411039 RepID=UPI003B7F0BC9